MIRLRKLALLGCLVNCIVPSGAATNDPLLTARYCTGCHNNKLKTAGVSLEGLEAATIPDHAEVWEKVIARLRSGMMSPPGLPRPDSATSFAFVKQLEGSIDRAALAKPDPGRTEALHRLNRNEYHKVIRDLLGLEVDVTSLLVCNYSVKTIQLR